MTTVAIDPNTLVGNDISHNRSTWRVTNYSPYDVEKLPNLVRICEEHDKFPGVFTCAKVLKSGETSKNTVNLFLCFTDGKSFVKMV